MLFLPRPSRLAAASVTLSLAACGSMGVDGQWTDPQRAPASLAGTKVLVVCEADEQVVKQICQDRIAAEVNAAGGLALILPNGAAEGPASNAPGRYLPAARRVGAGTVFHTVVTPAESHERSGFSVGFGMGGSIGGGGFGGIGMSAPVGGVRVTQQYAANGGLTEVDGGRLMWTAKSSARAGDDLKVQVDTVARALVAAARKAGFF